MGGAAVAFFGSHPEVLVVGKTSRGHAFLQEQCDACHTSWGGTPSERCASCHRADMVGDHHPATKFANAARWADVLETLDPTNCVVCHQEHADGPMGFTAAVDVCSRCHEDVGTVVPSHSGFAFKDCLSCHNYHHEGVLAYDVAKNLLARPTTFAPREPQHRPQLKRPRPQKLPSADAKPAVETASWRAAVHEWEGSSHSHAGVNCSTCHDAGRGEWTPKPTEKSCTFCHAEQVSSFHQGRHGARPGLGLDPNSPGHGQVQLAMRTDATRWTMTCQSCHGVHRTDREHARVDACLACHADQHSLSYRRSPHGVAFAKDPAAAPSCATCHLPRRTVTDSTGAQLRVTWHNNSFVSRPVERMAGEVCINCHDLGYAWSALRDPAQVQRNFAGVVVDDPQVSRHLKLVQEKATRRGP
jgi:hypothetical protein